jgi:hypothetical protein
MDQEYTTDRVPEKLTERFNVDRYASFFRRRAVFAQVNEVWELICCTVEGFRPTESIPESMQIRRYQKAILYEDFLDRSGCLKFAQELHDGEVCIDGKEFRRKLNVHWTTELVSVGNDHMSNAGYVINVNFPQSGSRSFVRPLLSPDCPYYPDIGEAGRDWMPFPTYHGENDGRNERIFFLLPEVRAFIKEAIFSETGDLEVTVDGTEVMTLTLIIKGAYWDGTVLHHIEGQVNALKAALTVPSDVDRLEYYLIDNMGVVYDFYRQDRFSQQRRPGRALRDVSRAHEDRVRNACRSGEGRKIEFKPFIDLLDKFSRSNDLARRGRVNEKLNEVIKTVAAFSNTEGGHIYLGINDDCEISGVDQSLQKWAKEEVGDAQINQYLGVLKSKIKGGISGEVALQLIPIRIDGVLVMCIEVHPGQHGPVALPQEYHLYMRSGASNRRASPDQWASILKINKTPNFLQTFV